MQKCQFSFSVVFTRTGSGSDVSGSVMIRDLNNVVLKEFSRMAKYTCFCKAVAGSRSAFDGNKKTTNQLLFVR